MNIHEYQAKALLKTYGVNVPNGQVAYTVGEASTAARKLGGELWAVKAQIHAGGRGKGGGVKIVKSIEDLKSATESILGMQLITPQTGPKGQEVSRVYIEEGTAIERELYLGLLIDRGTSTVTMMASTEGGMEIEEVATNTPEKILKAHIDPATGMQPFHARQLAFGLELKGKQIRKATALMMALYRAFMDLDADIIEINPLVITKDDDVIALDAKFSFDDSALYRHKDIQELRDETEEDPMEREAARHSLNYIKLDGSIGCMVNGAGLAMATMDLIKLCGGDPANFLDVGGGATRERVTAAFKIILSDPNVEGILVNIFGGIIRCEMIAEGIVDAAREVSLHVPLVVRLSGTNVDLGKSVLEKSGLPIITADDLSEAATKIVTAVKEAT